MATSKVLTFPSFALQAGDNRTPWSPLSGADHIGAGWSLVNLQMDTTAWAATDQIALATEFSEDGGATWQPGPSITLHGGVQTSKGGGQTNFAGVVGDLPSASTPTTAKTQGRVFLTVPSAGHSAGTVTFS